MGRVCQYHKHYKQKHGDKEISAISFQLHDYGIKRISFNARLDFGGCNHWTIYLSVHKYGFKYNLLGDFELLPGNSRGKFDNLLYQEF